MLQRLLGFLDLLGFLGGEADVFPVALDDFFEPFFFFDEVIEGAVFGAGAADVAPVTVFFSFLPPFDGGDVSAQELHGMEKRHSSEEHDDDEQDNVFHDSHLFPSRFACLIGATERAGTPALARIGRIGKEGDGRTSGLRLVFFLWSGCQGS